MTCTVDYARTLTGCLQLHHCPGRAERVKSAYGVGPAYAAPALRRRCGTPPQAYCRTFSQAGTRARHGDEAEREEQGVQGQRANAHLKHDAGDQQDAGDVARGGA